MSAVIPDFDQLTQRLTSGANPFAFCGIGLSHTGRTTFYTSSAPTITADENNIFRVASVSKIVTAAVFEGAANGVGMERPYDVDAGPVLGFDVRHPQFPDRTVTFGMLMTHTGGLTDAGGYVFDGALADGWDPQTMFGPHAPGTYFAYSNLGYILLAAAAEILSGQRFDVLVADALAPNGLIGGFNWAGLDKKAREQFLPTYRRDTKNYVAMIDGERPTLFEPDAAYKLGAHTARFSPQGGLRMSLRAMLDLAKVGAGVPRDPLWQKTNGAGDYLDGLFQDYGAGEQILPDPSFYPRPLVGHFGNAYGFQGGIWWDEQADMCFAYALNGAAMGDESDALSDAERQIFDAISQAA